MLRRTGFCVGVAVTIMRRRSSYQVVTRATPALLISIAVSCLAVSAAVAATLAVPVVFGGGALMKPLATSACKASYYKPKKLTYIECSDTGVYPFPGRSLGEAYHWRWTATAGSSVVREDGAFSLNVGDGAIFLTMKGTARPVGKVTTAAGTQKTTGTWKYASGTGAYKNKSGSGTYSFLIKRNARTYLVLAIGLKGRIH